MSITYNVRQVRGVTVVDVAGGMTLSERIASESSGALHDLVRNLVKHGNKKIVLNLRDVSYLDSSGIGELFGCVTTVQSEGGVLKLSNPTERVQNLLRLTKLNTVVDVMEHESTAVHSLSQAGAT